MSYNKGFQLQCDACKTTIFLPKLFGGAIATVPKGWFHSYDLGDMCPECAEKFMTYIRYLYAEEDIPYSWREGTYDYDYAGREEAWNEDFSN